MLRRGAFLPLGEHAARRKFGLPLESYAMHGQKRHVLSHPVTGCIIRNRAQRNMRINRRTDRVVTLPWPSTIGHGPPPSGRARVFMLWWGKTSELTDCADFNGGFSWGGKRSLPVGVCRCLPVSSGRSNTTHGWPIGRRNRANHVLRNSRHVANCIADGTRRAQ
jgi:hypothetical protein